MAFQGAHSKRLDMQPSKVPEGEGWTCSLAGRPQEEAGHAASQGAQGWDGSAASTLPPHCNMVCGHSKHLNHYVK